MSCLVSHSFQLYNRLAHYIIGDYDAFHRTAPVDHHTTTNLETMPEQ